MELSPRLRTTLEFLRNNTQYVTLIIYSLLLFMFGWFSLPVKIMLALGAASLIYAIPATSILVYVAVHTLMLVITATAVHPNTTEVYFGVGLYVLVELIHTALRFIVKRTSHLLEP